MRKHLRTILAGALVALATGVPASAEVGLGSDLVSRYVWRGSDLGDAVSVQPWISYSNDVVEIGAWSSNGKDRALEAAGDSEEGAIADSAAIILPSNDDGIGHNENDLYVSFGAGPVGITVTDYYLPTASPGDFFNYSDDDGIHIIEVSAAFEVGCASVMGAFNLLGDGDDSFLG